MAVEDLIILIDVLKKAPTFPRSSVFLLQISGFSTRYTVTLFAFIILHVINVIVIAVLWQLFL